MNSAKSKVLTLGGNTVAMTGRNAESATQPDRITIILADVTKEQDVIRLTVQIKNNFLALSVIINNVGKTFVNTGSAHAGAFEKASAEILTNDLSMLRLSEKPLRHLPSLTKAAIVNISSITAFTLLNNLSAYAVNKAALHSYPRALRMRRANSISIKAFTLTMPPPVVTEFSQATGESGGSPRFVTGIVPRAPKKTKYEIQAGRASEMDIFPSSLSARALLHPGKNTSN